jgi:hypothetical protein
MKPAMRILRTLFAAATLAAAAGCVTVSEGVDSMKEVDADSVLVVGKIEIVPPIKPEEQTYKATDPFNSKRHFIGRAVMFMSDKPKYAEHTGYVLNPPLEQTYFVKVPRAQRYMVKGSVTMAFAMRVVSRREAVTEQTELMFPAPAELDIRPGDKAIYIGTLRLHRDEFHEVTRAEVRDDFAAASADFKKKFGGQVSLRKALLKKPKP